MKKNINEKRINIVYVIKATIYTMCMITDKLGGGGVLLTLAQSLFAAGG